VDDIADQFNSAPFVPSTKQLLPLPAGLHAAVNEPEDRLSCGSGACYVQFTVTGTKGAV
jgi:hypothetical protein